MSENGNKTSTPRQGAFFAGINSAPKRSGIPRGAARFTVPEPPDFSTTAAVTARCYEGAGSAQLPSAALGDDFQGAVAEARRRTTDPTWRAESLETPA
jgi:hypothetical protein